MSFDRATWLRELRTRTSPSGYSFAHARFLPDKLVHHPSEYEGEAEVVVSCTQQENQTKLVRAWARMLPTMTDLRTVHFCSRFPTALIEPLGEMVWLESLHIKWSGVKSIGPWRGLANLQEFHLGSSPSLADPEVVLEWPKLRRLSFENIRSIYDIEWVSAMRNMTELSLTGSMWTRQKLLSLRPLHRLSKLERLSLIATTVKDKESLFVLADMSSLRSFDTAYYWPKGSLDRLAELRRDLWIGGMKWPDFEVPTLGQFVDD